jgi:hypothetical protein
MGKIWGKKKKTILGKKHVKQKKRKKGGEGNEKSNVGKAIVLSPRILEYYLTSYGKSVKQRLRKTNPNVLIKVKVEIEKQWNADFLKVVKYLQWVSNIVVVPKKEDKIRVWTLGTKIGLALKIIFLYHTWMYWSIHIFLYGWIFGLQLYENGARG